MKEKREFRTNGKDILEAKKEYIRGRDQRIRFTTLNVTDSYNSTFPGNVTVAYMPDETWPNSFIVAFSFCSPKEKDRLGERTIKVEGQFQALRRIESYSEANEYRRSVFVRIITRKKEVRLREEIIESAVDVAILKRIRWLLGLLKTQHSLI